MDVMTNKEYIDVLEIYLKKYKKFSSIVGHKKEITGAEGDVLYSMLLSLLNNICDIQKEDVVDMLELMKDKLIPNSNTDDDCYVFEDDIGEIK